MLIVACCAYTAKGKCFISKNYIIKYCVCKTTIIQLLKLWVLHTLFSKSIDEYQNTNNKTTATQIKLVVPQKLKLYF